MNDSKISVRYAKALFMLAQDRKVLDEVRADVELVFGLIQTVDKFAFFIDSHTLSPEKKNAIINSVFKNSITKETHDFLNLLVKNKRETFLPMIVRNYLTMYKKYKGIQKAVFTTVITPSADLQQKVKKMVAESFDARIELELIQDMDILGGFILRVEDKQIDASVSKQLKQIKSQLENISFQ